MAIEYKLVGDWPDSLDINTKHSVRVIDTYYDTNSDVTLGKEIDNLVIELEYLGDM